MYSMYHTFNFLTGYSQVNPTVQSIEWRLIVLESVAGVPGFVAAGTKIFGWRDIPGSAEIRHISKFPSLTEENNIQQVSVISDHSEHLREIMAGSPLFLRKQRMKECTCYYA